MTTDYRKEAKGLLHDCDRSARYHAARRAFLDFWHRVLMVVVLLSGSAAIAMLNDAIGGGGAFELTITMIIPTLIGAFSAVWNLPGRARDHEFLAREFYRIAKSIDIEEADRDKVRKWNEMILDAYAEEPAVYHALNAECYNAATAARIRDSKRLLHVRWYHHMLRNWIRFSERDFPLVEKESTSLAETP